MICGCCVASPDSITTRHELDELEKSLAQQTLQSREPPPHDGENSAEAASISDMEGLQLKLDEQRKVMEEDFQSKLREERETIKAALLQEVRRTVSRLVT